jgi:hypothetical protein
MKFSQGTRSLDMSRFLVLSLIDNGFFLLRFFGISVFGAALCTSGSAKGFPGIPPRRLHRSCGASVEAAHSVASTKQGIPTM